MVDLAIAAEALFLGESDTKAELNYRIALHYACFSDIPGTSRRERFDEMRRVYGLRSSVVHGGKLGAKDATSLPEFTAAFGSRLRFVTRAMIKKAHENPGLKPLNEWETIILGR